MTGTIGIEEIAKTNEEFHKPTRRVIDFTAPYDIIYAEFRRTYDNENKSEALKIIFDNPGLFRLLTDKEGKILFGEYLSQKVNGFGKIVEKNSEADGQC